MLKFETKNRQDTCYQTKGEKSMFEQIFTIFDKNWHNEEIMQESKPPSQKGYTLAEGATHVAMSDNSRKFGFTLAEVLITLAVIGVVAAITMPMLITNVRNHVRAKRIENIEQKFSKATDKMVALGVYNGHGSTAEFVNELGKHLKLAKVCDNSNLASCWPYSEVQLSDGKMWEISKTKTGKTMKMKDDDSQTWSDTMGIITADGTSMILSYNTQCAIDDTKAISWSGSKSSTTGCVAGIYDWNGATKPNKYSDDVLAFNSKGLGSSCAIEIGELCLSAPFIPTPIDWVTAQEMYNNGKYAKLGIKSLCTDIDCQTKGDYWAGAVKECGGVDKMPTLLQLGKLEEEMYLTQNGTRPTVGAYDEVRSLVFQPNSPTAQALALTPTFSLWSSEIEDDIWPCVRIYDTSSPYYDSFSRSDTDPNGICIGY